MPMGSGYYFLMEKNILPLISKVVDSCPESWPSEASLIEKSHFPNVPILIFSTSGNSVIFHGISSKRVPISHNRGILGG